VDPVDIARAIEAARADGAALLAAPTTDTIKLVEQGVVVQTPPRETCWAAQTPQVFRAEILREAHAKAVVDGFIGTDDAQLVERLGIAVHVVAGSAHNIKITHREDIELAEAWLAENG
jgi:2-C-methyl-D-erythritol 4-phosphate cytidylyltransferase